MLLIGKLAGLGRNSTKTQLNGEYVKLGRKRVKSPCCRTNEEICNHEFALRRDGRPSICSKTKLIASITIQVTTSGPEAIGDIQQ